jgi:hypothetical protein
MVCKARANDASFALEDGVTAGYEEAESTSSMTLLNIIPASYTWQSYGARVPPLGRKHSGQISIYLLRFVELHKRSLSRFIRSAPRGISIAFA